jgi:hypothetical protein
MVTQEDTSIKFRACFGLYKNNIPQFDTSTYSEAGMNISDFRKMLIKNDMEEYENELISFWYAEIQNKQKIESFLNKNVNRDDVRQLEIDLTETLIFLLSNTSGDNISITFQKSRNSKTTGNTAMIDCVIQSLLTEYEKHDFNLTEMEYDEAEDELKGWCDTDWIENYILEDRKENPRKYHIRCEQDIYHFDSFETFHDCLDDIMIEKYARDHCSYKEITLDFLIENLGLLKKNSKKKVGAKPKNIRLLYVATNLSYLKRIDRFILNTDGVKNINQLKLSNKDYRFIHDCLVFFGLCEDYSKNEINSTTPEKYICTTLNQKNNSLVNRNEHNGRFIYQTVSGLMQ